MNNTGSIALLSARLHEGGVADHVASLAKALEKLGTVVLTLERVSDFVRETQSQCNRQGISWIGIHFVAYGWARHGILSNRDIAEIREACADRRVALYFHELWLGESQNTTLQNRLLGFIQRRRLLHLIRALAPDKVLTSNSTYQAMLARYHVAANVLPLFGNLPAATDKDRADARAWLASNAIDDQTSLIAVFGTIHPEWDAAPALRDWLARANRAQSSVTLITLGQHGPVGSVRLRQLQQDLPQLRIISTGTKPAPFLAGLLRECTFGLATTPWALIGKSGTAAAMREAGLPVLVTRDDWHWRYGQTPFPTDDPQLVLWSNDRRFDWDTFLAGRNAPSQNLPQAAEAWQQIARSS